MMHAEVFITHEVRLTGWNDSIQLLNDSREIKLAAAWWPF